MAETIVSAPNINGFLFARSDGEFEQHLQEAAEASNDDYAFRTQLEEALRFSNQTLTYDLQLADIAISYPLSDPSSSNDGAFFPFSKDEAASSSSKDEKESMPVNCYQQDYGYGGEKEGNSRGKEVDTGLEWRQSRVQKPVLLEPCGICYEDAAAEIFEGIHCLHRFCHPCMTKYIHTRLEQKRHQIYCPHESCGELLAPQECGYFLPAEILDAWSAVILEAEIPESQKVYCPFPDCSALLVNEDAAGLSAEEIVNAECPFCNKMFCVRCMVPWHADLDCEVFQKLPPAERSEADLRLFKLAETQKWQRCGNCKRMIEREYGCNQMTCRCGYEFCYVCGSGWISGRHKCNCHRL